MTTLTAKPRLPRAGKTVTHTERNTMRNAKTLVTLMALLGLALFAPALASAEFSRPYIGQITGTPTGQHGEQVPFGELGGLAIDLNPLEENVYVGEHYPNDVVDEFNSSNVFMSPQITGLPTGSLAYHDELPEKLEGAAGKYELEWVAVDNSTGLTDEARGDVYVASEAGETRTQGVVRRVDAEGNPVDFTCTAPGSDEYVKGNELTGRPGEDGRPAEAWESVLEPVSGVAVDSGGGASAGDIYVIYREGGNPQVDEFTPAGCFLGAITRANVPEKEAFPAEGISGIAVDPDGDVLVEAEKPDRTTAAIYEFSEAGLFLGEIGGSSKTDQFEEDALSFGGGSMAVSSKGDLYVNVREEEENEKHEVVGYKYVVDEFGPGAFYPRVVTGGVSGARSGSVTLNGAVGGVESNVTKEDLKLSECKFEYVSEEAFAKAGFEVLSSGGVAPCAPDLDGQRLQEKNYLVHATVENLEAGTVYRYRLLAETARGELGIVREGAAESFAAPDEPVVSDVSVGDVSSSWADFHATIDPLGEDTTYQVQYVPASAYEAAVAAGAADPYLGGGSVPVPAGDVGAGDVPVSVNVQASGLSPGTSYDYRVVASNGVGVSDGADGTFSTSPAVVPGLPDRRSYEMLTPPNKEDGEDMFGGPEEEGGLRAKEGLGGALNYETGYSSEDGDRFLLQNASSAFGSFPASFGDSYVFARGADGWSFQPAASPSLGVQSGKASVYDPLDFSAIGFQDSLGNPGELQPIVNLVGPAGGPYTTIESGVTKRQGEAAPTEAKMVGASADLSNVILESEDRELGAGKEASKQDEQSNALYQWTAAGGLRVVNFNPEGKLLQCGAILGQETGEKNLPAGSTHGAVSADGSRIFFTAPDPLPPAELGPTGSGCWDGAKKNPPELYVRENGESTVEVSAPEGEVKEGGSNPAEPAIFVGASKDGSKVFFMTRTELTEEAVKLGLHDMELYEYDFEAPAGERLTRVSRGQSEAGTPATDAGAVEDVPAVSGDGSAVYFNAVAELVHHPGGGGGLYRYDTLTQQTAYVAPSPGYPAPQVAGGVGLYQETWYAHVLDPGLSGKNGGGEHYAGLDVTANYYTTADGGFLIFPSRQDIADYDSNGQQELYRYDAEAGSIVCVSCNPDGSNPSYGATFTRSAPYVENPAGTPPRPISEDGRYVFFDTVESLTPADTNGKVDVYEWHEDPETHQTAISSISTGQSTTNDFFLDSSPDGKNVFFGTHSALVPADKDNQGDLYDARIEGGFPAPLPPGICEGDACTPAPPLPLFQTPATNTLASSGNVASPSPPPVVKKTATCKKGFVKKKVKTKTECFKKPKKKSKAKKSSKSKRGGKS